MMGDEDNTKSLIIDQIIHEFEAMRQRIVELERLVDEGKRTEE